MGVSDWQTGCFSVLSSLFSISILGHPHCYEHRPPSQGCSLRRRNSRRHIGRCLPDRMGAQLISSSSRVFSGHAVGFAEPVSAGSALLFR